MQNENDTPKPEDLPQQVTGDGCPESSCSAWRDADSAPKDGTIIIAHFGWPWPVTAIWDPENEEWSTAQLSPCGPEKSVGWETEWEKSSSLIGWQPLPSLPNIHLSKPKNPNK
jgi:hypothetical protein